MYPENCRLQWLQDWDGIYQALLLCNEHEENNTHSQTSTETSGAAPQTRSKTADAALQTKREPSAAINNFKQTEKKQIRVS